LTIPFFVLNAGMNKAAANRTHVSLNARLVARRDDGKRHAKTSYNAARENKGRGSQNIPVLLKPFHVVSPADRAFSECE
jgi:hypothetical protein